MKKKNIVREKCVNCAPWCRTLAPESFKTPSLCILYTAGLNLPKNIYKYIYIYTHSWPHRWAIIRGRAGLQRLLDYFKLARELN